MAQKYKVFIEEKSIIFTDVELCNLKNMNFLIAEDYKSLHNELETTNQLFTENAMESMFDFFQNFKFIEASGGIVQYGNLFLFIKRNGCWDIPKGKIEKNETPESAAIREIQEECGLKGELTIRKKLVDTYHTYEFKNKSVFKKTHWYLLDYTGDKTTVPQLEEGITEICWIQKDEFWRIESNTYASIIDVLIAHGNS
jgi:8-oxo-dGTP pyrophosphatase MutT (NUDIX family)